MPNGITAAIYEGKPVSRNDFLMRVARSYTLAIMQREDDPNAPVRRDGADTRYHDEEIAKAQALLVELADLSLEDASARAKSQHAKAMDDWRERRSKVIALRSRYEAMIREVEAWEPEPLVAYIKDGALKNLRGSLDFDCGKPGEEMRYYRFPKFLSGADWLREQTTAARKSIDYHRDAIERQKAVTAQRNEHIDAFLRSLNGDGQ